jgi:probable HAF family extracellular repeat protein
VINSLLSHNQAIGEGGNPPQPGTPGGGSGGAIYNDGNTMTLSILGSLIEDYMVNAHGTAIFPATETLKLVSPFLWWYARCEASGWLFDDIVGYEPRIRIQRKGGTNPMRPKLTAAILCVATLCCASQVHAAFFKGLGFLPGEDAFSQAYAVSADGSVVVGFSNSDFKSEAFRWTQATGMVGLGDLAGGDFFSNAYSVSADGSVVVGQSSSASGNQAFRWTESGGMVGLDLTVAKAVSADGSVVIGSSAGQACRWTENGGLVGLGFTRATAVSADGSVVVGRSDGEAFLWTEAGGTGLGYLPVGKHISDAKAVSADGSVVVGSSGHLAFRWTQSSGMAGLGDLGDGSDDLFNSQANGVSADGATIVGISHSDSGWRAFTWDSDNGMRTLEEVLVNTYGLDLNGWSLESALDISDDGSTIVGYGWNPDGQQEAWIASTNPVPIPGAIWLLGAGLFGLAGLRFSTAAEQTQKST